MNEEHSQMAMSSISHAADMAGVAWQMAAAAHEEVAIELKRPFMLLKPTLTKDGDQWCALYGENLMEGVAGFGLTPDLASKAFDLEWVGAEPAITVKR